MVMTHLSEVFAWLFLLVAWVGHGALCTYSHNYWYGQALPRRMTDFIQVSHGLLVLLAPLLFWWLGAFSLALSPNETSWDIGQWLLASYLLACVVAGLVIFPVITVQRLTRPTV